MMAVIMAGGRGTRLHPLTDTIPKPMARLCGRPVVEYILELLAKNGVTESVLTLQYLPNQLTQHFEIGVYAGIKLRFCEEGEPLGTAGSVKNAVGDGGNTVLVISGDALCDLPLADAVKAHRESGAAATIVTVKVSDPREYGLVIADNNGCVTGFVEKPSFAQATSELANTGIYILSQSALDMIPTGKKFDFASELFPAMLKAGLKLLSCELAGYWCDIGDLSAYRKAQRDILDGRVRITPRGSFDDEGNLFAGRRPSGTYELSAPVYIGDGVRIGSGAVIGAGSVLDDGCAVGAGAQVDGGILLPHCVIGDSASVASAVVCPGASVKARAALLEGSAVGEKATIGERAVIHAEVRVSGGASVADGAEAVEHVGAHGSFRHAFDDDGLCGEIGVELTVELAVRVGCAVGTIAASGKNPVGLAKSGERSAGVLCDAMIAGIRSAGASVLDFGCAFPAMLSFAMGNNALSLGVYIGADAALHGSIRVVGAFGLPAARPVEREIETLLARGEFSRAPAGDFGGLTIARGVGTAYLGELSRLAPDGLAGMSACVTGKNRMARKLLSSALERLGCDVSCTGTDRITLHLSENGERLALSQRGAAISAHRAVIAYFVTMFEQQRDVAAENDFPRAAETLARERGRQVYRYLRCPADGSDAIGRKLAERQCSRDGLMLAVALLNYMRENALTFTELGARVPPIAVEERTVPIDRPPAQVLRIFAESPGFERAGEGVLVRGESGVVLLRPRKNGSAIRVFAEAASWEIARELCADFSGKLGLTLDKKGTNE